MEVSSLAELQRLEPALRCGWTVPKTTRDWNSMWWAKPLVIAGLITLRRQLPGAVRRDAPGLGVTSVWAYHSVITAGLVHACEEAGVQADRLDRGRARARCGASPSSVWTGSAATIRAFSHSSDYAGRVARPGTRSMPRSSK